MVSIDFDATSAPELMPMLRAVLRQAFDKDVKVIMLGHIAIGLPLGHMALEQVAAEYGEELRRRLRGPRATAPAT